MRYSPGDFFSLSSLSLISAITNTVIGTLLVVLGVSLLMAKKKPGKGKRIGGIICLVIGLGGLISGVIRFILL